MNEIENPHALSRRTTPTWEVELLISGVAVFAMLQLPGLLDDALFALEPRTNADWRTTALLTFIYAKSAAVVLALTFVLHLLLRALWIALVGIHSVYPQGVRLDQLKLGPIQYRVHHATPIDLPTAIERADNRASVVFAIGVMVAVLLAVICIGFPGSLVVLNLLAWLLGLHFNPVLVFAIVAALVAAPFFLAALIDQTLGTRLRPEGLTYRCTYAILRKGSWLGLGSSHNLIMKVVSSNDGPKRMHAVLFGIMMLALGSVAMSMVAMRKPEWVGNYGLFPKSEALQLSASHYADQRTPARAGTPPYIQSNVISGPYLELTVPYDPLRVEPAMQRCTQAHTQDTQASALLMCLTALHRVTLDGKPLPNLRYDISADAPTGRPALLAMLDVRALANGRHVLTVARPPRSDKAPDPKSPDPGHYRIVFWR